MQGGLADGNNTGELKERKGQLQGLKLSSRHGVWKLGHFLLFLFSFSHGTYVLENLIHSFTLHIPEI